MVSASVGVPQMSPSVPTDLVAAPVDDLLDLVAVLLELEQHFDHRPFPLEGVLLVLVQIKLCGSKSSEPSICTVFIVDKR